jgi:hypothetical protein
MPGKSDEAEEVGKDVLKVGCGLFTALALVAWLSYKVIMWLCNQTS